jgi:hypothetical protein
MTHATFEAAQAAILNRSEIQLRADKKGREYAVFWSRHTGWTRCNTDQAKVILAGRA